MLDNFFAQTFYSLDPKACHSIADHMEAHAKMLRRHAETAEARHVHALREDVRRHNAAKLALLAVDQGKDERNAIYGAALTYQMEARVVEANYRLLLKRREKKAKATKRQRIRKLYEEGLSLRDIGRRIGISHTAAAKALKGA